MTSATVDLDTQNHVGPIDRRIFGGFLEHLGRAIYGGVYDPGSPLADAVGYRLDVIGKLRELRMPIMRYPGGNFVSCYDWRDGIGPREKRPQRKDEAWKSIDTNQFGTDEFMRWAKMLGTEPMMAVNLGTRRAAEAVELLQYCNATTGPLADERKKNGHADPYNIKLWCLGNEMDGPWQSGHCSDVEYSARAGDASTQMKKIDPTIQTIVCGSSGPFMKTYLQWDRTVIENCWETADYVSAHFYASNERKDTPWFLAEGIQVDRIIDDYAKLFEQIRQTKQSKKSFYVSFDEWNVWYRERGGDGGWQEAPHLLEEVYNLEDALVCAQFLNAFIRRADVVKIACLAQIVNVIAPILTHRDGLLVQSIYHPIELMSKNAIGVSLQTKIDSPTYKAGERGDVPAIDVSAAYDPESCDASFFIVNRNPQSPAKVVLRFADRAVFKIVTAEGMGGQDAKTANSWESPNSVARFAVDAKIVDGNLEVPLKAPGFAAVRVATTGR